MTNVTNLWQKAPLNTLVIVVKTSHSKLEILIIIIINVIGTCLVRGRNIFEVRGVKLILANVPHYTQSNVNISLVFSNSSKTCSFVIMVTS